MSGPEAFPQPGQWASVEGMSQPGRIVSVDASRRRAEVQVGSLILKLPWGRLARSSPTEAVEGRSAAIQIRAAQGGVEHELDLHGLRVEEALEALSRFLDSAVVNRLSEVKVIHGHGSGKLRRAVRDYLGRHPQVREYHFGGPAQGGVAVTVVHMREG